MRGTSSNVGSVEMRKSPRRPTSCSCSAISSLFSIPLSFPSGGQRSVAGSRHLDGLTGSREGEFTLTERSDTSRTPEGETMMKKTGTERSEFPELEQFPNVGPAVAAGLRRVGVNQPQDLQGRDPYALFKDLGQVTGQRHDPCLLDTFIAAVRFMEGEPRRPWWKYTAERKRTLAAR